MSWLNAWALPFLLLPIFAFLHIRRLRKQQVVPSLLYFQAMSKRRALPHIQLKHQKDRWIYAFLLLLAALLMLDLLMPVQSNKTLIIVDNSGSMGRKAKAEGDETVFANTMAEVGREAEARIAAGEAVRVVPMVGERGAAVYTETSSALQKQLQSIQYLAWGARVERRIPQLLALKGRDDVGDVLVYTDQALAEDVDLPAGVQWNQQTSTAPAVNLGWVAARQPAGVNDFPYHTYLVLRNFSDRRIERIKIVVEHPTTSELLPLRGLLTLKPREERQIQINKLPEKLGEPLKPVRVIVQHELDNLAADNAIWVLPPNPPKLRVALMRCNPAGFLWSEVFPHPGVDLRDVRGGTPPKGRWDVMIYDGCPEAPTIQSKPDTATGASVDESEISGAYSDNNIIVSVPRKAEPLPVLYHASLSGSAVLRDIKPLRGMIMYSPTPLKPPNFDRSTVLFGPKETAATDEVFAWTGEDGKRRWLYLGFNPHVSCNQGDGAVHYNQDDCFSLVFMMKNAFEWMANEKRVRPQYLPNGAVYVGSGDGQNELLRAGADSVSAMLAGYDQWLLQDTDRYLYLSDRERVWLSSGMLDAEESAVNVAPLQLRLDIAEALMKPKARPVWLWLLAAMAVLMLLEGILLFVKRRKLLEQPA